MIREQFARKILNSSNVNYEMLSNLLSSINYFHHFDDVTR